MKKAGLISFILICFFCLSSHAQITQPGQNSILNSTMNTPNGGYSESVTPLDAPPHKGVVKEAGKYYIEVVVNWMMSNHNAMFYLIKSDGKAVEREKISCSAVIIRKGQENEVLSVTPYGVNAFSTQLKSGESYHLQVTFKKKKKEYTALFQTNGDGSQPKETKHKKSSGGSGHQHNH